MAEGLLGSSSPHVGEQFRRITDNFMRLSNIHGETAGYISPEDERTTLVGQGSGTQLQVSSSSSASVRSPAAAENMSGAASHTGSSSHAVTAMTTTATQAAPASLSYEVVAQATPDNASFPFSSTFDAQNISTFMQAPSPYNTLPLSASYSFHEQTFGRRLQRRTNERGLVLASMANPPPERYAAVFGFSLLFESREDIVKRLAAQLSNMEMPYQTQQQRQRAPHEERIEQKIRLTFGYEKEFLNSDEIELYLSRLGIHIPHQAEYIEAEVDINELANADFPGQLTPPLMTHEQTPSYGMTMQATYDTASGSSSMAPDVQIHVTSSQPNTMAQYGQYGIQGMWSHTQWAKAKLTISTSMLVEGTKLTTHLRNETRTNGIQNWRLNLSAWASTLECASRMSTTPSKLQQALLQHASGAVCFSSRTFILVGFEQM